MPSIPIKRRSIMKMLLAIAAVLFVPACSYAQGAKACEELKTEIAAKLDAKGVKGYTLDIVAKEADADGKVVGTCEGGTKKIVYKKGEGAMKSEKKEPGKV
jgi:outer membrane lipoprotein-sorting protein